MKLFTNVVVCLIALWSSSTCFSQEIIGVASADSTTDLYGWIDFQPLETSVVAFDVVWPDGTVDPHLAFVDSNGYFAANTFSQNPASDYFTIGLFTIYDVNSLEILRSGLVVVVVDTDDLGDDWTELDIKDEDNWEGCKDVAENIKEKLGGSAEIKIIKPKNTEYLGKYREIEPSWIKHWVVVKDGKVYDGFGPRKGLTIDEYTDLWDGEDTDIDFGF
jgi:hypothetical protein